MENNLSKTNVALGPGTATGTTPAWSDRGFILN
jgi:hypothetical protein